MTASILSSAPDTQISTVTAAKGLMTRNLRGVARMPSTFLPTLLMPVFQTVAFSGAFFAITKIPGFPTSRSVNWFLPFGACMGSAFSGLGMGFSLIRDMETGFFDRLRMSPTPRRSLILGALFAAWSRTAIVLTIVLGVGFALGARLTGGVLGLLCLYLAGLGISTAATGWGLGLAYRFRDMRGAAIMQLGMFVFMFLSTAQVPLAVMRGWLHSVARVNPMTNVFRMARQGFLGHVTWANTWGGLMALAVLSAVLLTFARRGLNTLDK